MKHLADLRAISVSRQLETLSHAATQCARVAMSGQRAALEWTDNEIRQGVCLDPLRYPLGRGLIEARSDVFGGLHGFLADSLPEAWGMRLLARRLRRTGMSLQAMTGIQRLSLVGHQGRGALVYDPCCEDNEEIERRANDLDIDALARAANLVLNASPDQEDQQIVEILELLGSGSGGARPKAHINLNGEAWIVKFPGPADPVDIGPIEQAYMLMASACGLEVMPSRIIASPNGPGYFATKRFDRLNGGGRVHMVSLCGALEAPSGFTAIGYDAFFRATMAITRDQRDVEAAFLRMIFNILACNRDDHSRQHAFLQDTNGAWRLSPAYDLTFSHGPGGERELDIDGEARHPTRTHVVNLAKRHGLALSKIDQMVSATRSVLGAWEQFATSSGVSQPSRFDIGVTLTKIDRDFHA